MRWESPATSRALSCSTTQVCHYMTTVIYIEYCKLYCVGNADYHVVTKTDICAPFSSENKHATSFVFGDPDLLSRTDNLIVARHLSVFLPYFHCEFAVTAIFPAFGYNHGIAIRFSDHYFLKESHNLAIWRYLQLFSYTAQIENLHLHISISVYLT